MFKPVYGVGGTLVAGISALATLILPTADLYSQLEAVLGEGGSDHTYMLITDGVQVEVVKVTQLSAGYLSVVRGRDGTTATAFPLGSSMYFQMTNIAVEEIVSAAIADAGLPSGLTFAINEPHTVEQDGDEVVINIEKLPLTSPNSTVDVTEVGDGYGIDIERGAFGCCPTP